MISSPAGQAISTNHLQSDSAAPDSQSRGTFSTSERWGQEESGLLVSTERSPGVNLRRRSPCQSCIMSSLPQQTPGSLVLVTLQFGVDDGAGSTADHHFLSALHLIAQVGQAALGVHLKLLLRRPARKQEPGLVNNWRWKLQLRLTLGRYLFLGRDPLLVSLPPRRVVDVKECFVPCGDSTRSEQLKTNKSD